MMAAAALTVLVIVVMVVVMLFFVLVGVLFVGPVSYTHLDEKGPVGGGTHDRFVINNAKFAAKAEAKKG